MKFSLEIDPSLNTSLAKIINGYTNDIYAKLTLEELSKDELGEIINSLKEINSTRGSEYYCLYEDMSINFGNNLWAVTIHSSLLIIESLLGWIFHYRSSPFVFALEYYESVKFIGDSKRIDYCADLCLKLQKGEYFDRFW